jgi:hypothetical protein
MAPAVKMVVVAFALMMAIGSLYFVPLWHARGRFTLGESSVFNYLVHVDLVRTGWYLQNPGLARGSFTDPLQEIFSSPKAYAFALPCSCTHPLRFDPSVWVDGLTPRFVLSRQITTVLSNLRQNKAIALAFATAIGVRLVLIYFRRHGADVSWFRNTWSICFIGIVGCVMYVLVNVEPRYVAAFLVLFWCGIIFSFRIPRNLDGKVVTVATLVVIVPLLLPVSWLTLQKYREGQGKTNSDALAAAELERLGIGRGDYVGRIQSPVGVLRIARITVVAEVNTEQTDVFWNSPVTTHHELLHIFAQHGCKAVIAASPKLNASNRSEWTQLGPTMYWVWRPRSE